MTTIANPTTLVSVDLSEVLSSEEINLKIIRYVQQCFDVNQKTPAHELLRELPLQAYTRVKELRSKIKIELFEMSNKIRADYSELRTNQSKNGPLAWSAHGDCARLKNKYRTHHVLYSILNGNLFVNVESSHADHFHFEKFKINVFTLLHYLNPSNS